MSENNWSPEKGQFIDARYTIGKELGRGGMGVVYQAYDIKLQRDVAIKFLFPDYCKDHATVQRFQQEALAAGRIGHENICDVRDLGKTDDGSHFIVMELLEGQPLSELLCERGRLDPESAVEIIIQILAALEAAHNVRIAHRDLKPENVFLVKTVSNGARVKLFDFGVAKFLNKQEDLQLTKTNTVVGSPYYMSPEQARGSKAVSHLTDIWSTAVILFELITGVLPFQGDNYNEVMANIITKSIPDPRTHVSISVELARIIRKGMNKDLSERFGSAEEFRAELEDFLENLETAHEFTEIEEDLEEEEEETTIFELEPLAQDSRHSQQTPNETAYWEQAAGSMKSPYRQPAFWAIAILGVIVVGTTVFFLFYDSSARSSYDSQTSIVSTSDADILPVEFDSSIEPEHDAQIAKVQVDARTELDGDNTDADEEREFIPRSEVKSHRENSHSKGGFIREIDWEETPNYGEEQSPFPEKPPTPPKNRPRKIVDTFRRDNPFD